LSVFVITPTGGGAHPFVPRMHGAAFGFPILSVIHHGLYKKRYTISKAGHGLSPLRDVEQCRFELLSQVRLVTVSTALPWFAWR